LRDSSRRSEPLGRWPKGKAMTKQNIKFIETKVAANCRVFNPKLDNKFNFIESRPYSVKKNKFFSTFAR
jgi:hypothetical protein